MDHRGIQRTLFRMQLDPEFAGRVRAGVVSELGGAELDLLRAAEPAAIVADRKGKRRSQFLGNVSGELALSIAAGLDAEGFTASAEFHAAVRADRSLPLAFAAYARRAGHGGPKALCALVELETALCRARRELHQRPAPRSGEVALAPWVSVQDLPGGTLALAAKLRASIDAGAPLPEVALSDAPDETLLIRATPVAALFRLREVEVEHLSSALADLLRAALEPCTRSRLAACTSTPRAELDPVIDELVREGILVAG